MSARPTAPGRAAFRLWRTIPTRWDDNDIYGHVNNVRYYAFFDTAVNAALIEAGHLDPHRGGTVGLVVGSACDFFAELVFPEPVEAGIATTRVGGSSITYAIGLFRPDAPTAAAAGRFTHVHVDRESRRPVPLPDALRAWAEGIAQ